MTPVLCWRASACGQRRTHAVGCHIGWSASQALQLTASEEAQAFGRSIGSSMEGPRLGGIDRVGDEGQVVLSRACDPVDDAGPGSPHDGGVGMVASTLVTSPSASGAASVEVIVVRPTFICGESASLISVRIRERSGGRGHARC